MGKSDAQLGRGCPPAFPFELQGHEAGAGVTFFLDISRPLAEGGWECHPIGSSATVVMVRG